MSYQYPVSVCIFHSLNHLSCKLHVVRVFNKENNLKKVIHYVEMMKFITEGYCFPSNLIKRPYAWILYYKYDMVE